MKLIKSSLMSNTGLIRYSDDLLFQSESKLNQPDLKILSSAKKNKTIRFKFKMHENSLSNMYEFLLQSHCVEIYI